MTHITKTISTKGQSCEVAGVAVNPHATIVSSGRFLKIAAVHDEFWLESIQVPEPLDAVAHLRKGKHTPDLFTFAQKLPDVSPKYSFQIEWDNLAVATFESYDDWFENQINRSVKKHIRKAAREGVLVSEVTFSDELVQGIHAIYNETPVRQGRKFWHYGKDIEAVKTANETYLSRSVFLGAYEGVTLIGFIKLVFDGKVALIMQILSRASHFELRPTNALLAKAVEVCAARGVKQLTYGEYAYGNKEESTLVDFKRNNGFVRVDIPRYYIPLTIVGRFALKWGLHRGGRRLLPASVSSQALKIRAWWLATTATESGAAASKE